MKLDMFKNHFVKKIILSLTVLALTAGVANAATITYDFNSTPVGTYTEENFSALFPHVSFDNTSGTSFYVRTPDLNPAFSGNVILNSSSWTQGSSTIATFSQLVSSVSVTMGDRGSDSDYISLNAYDSAHNLIDSDSFTIPLHVAIGHNLSVSSAANNIASVEFYGIGVDQNSVYWDNFSFTPVNSPVPEPSSIVLGLMSLAGAMGMRKRRPVA